MYEESIRAVNHPVGCCCRSAAFMAPFGRAPFTLMRDLASGRHGEQGMEEDVSPALDVLPVAGLVGPVAPPPF